jgi:hypothetical protein
MNDVETLKCEAVHAYRVAFHATSADAPAAYIMARAASDSYYAEYHKTSGNGHDYKTANPHVVAQYKPEECK